jgi:hypothetical protein
MQMVEPQHKSYSSTVEEDPNTGECLVSIPDNLLNELGWQEGDLLEWDVIDGKVHVWKFGDQGLSSQ